VLNLDDQNLTITQRVRTNLGREPALASLPHFNVNTEGDGVVYLRGYVHNEEQRRTAALVAGTTEGVSRVVNELHIEQAVNL
jgi:osmotically-inducible protein OsmY